MHTRWVGVGPTMATDGATDRSPPLLRVRGLTVAYRSGPIALHGVDLDVPAGGVATVVGASGAGRTTLLRAVSGLLGSHAARVVGGTIELDGERIDGGDAAAIVRRGVSHVMEGRRIFKDLTVDENLRVGGLTRGRADSAVALERVRALLPVLAERGPAVAGYLSGGQQQLLAIGRALMASPRLLLLDEPWVGLAPDLVDEVRAVVAELVRGGLTVLVTGAGSTGLEGGEHRSYRLDAGTLTEGGPPTAPTSLRASGVAARPAHRRAAGVGPPVLALQDVSLNFGAVQALDGVTLSVSPGEAVAVIGPNGAGKTSVLNCINQVHRAARGSVRTGGRELIGLRPEQVAALGVARTFQTPAAFAGLDVLDNLLLGCHHRMRSGVVRAALRWPGARNEEAAARRRCDELADRLGLGPYRRRAVGSLPFGVQKRVELGRAMAMAPRLLLLDEPSAGMSSAEADELAGAIAGLRGDDGPAILVVEHDLRFVAELADRVLVMERGRIVASPAASPAAVVNRPAEAHLGARAARPGVLT